MAARALRLFKNTQTELVEYDLLSSSSLKSSLLLISLCLLPPVPNTSKSGTHMFHVLRRLKTKGQIYDGYSVSVIFCCPHNNKAKTIRFHIHVLLGMQNWNDTSHVLCW